MPANTGFTNHIQAMALSRILLAALVVTVYFILWREAERRLRPEPVLPARGLEAGVALLTAEGLLLTLFAALWFGSLGAGGAVPLFLVVGALMEVGRVRQSPSGSLAWKPMALGMVRIVIAGALLGRILG